MKRLLPLLSASVLASACANDWDELYTRCVADGRCGDGGSSAGGTAGSGTGGGVAGGSATAGGSAMAGGTAGGSAMAGGTAGGSAMAGGTAGGSAMGGGSTMGGGSAMGGGSTMGPRLVWDPPTADAGTLEPGLMSSVTLTLRNDGDQAATPLNSVAVAAPPMGFTVTASNCTGRTFMPGEFCDATVRFAPTSDGSFGATLEALRSGQVIAAAGLVGRAVSSPVHLSVRTDGGSGQGSVRVAATGFSDTDCASQCELDFPRNTVVTLTQTPNRSTFVRLDGCGDGGPSPCQLTLTSDAGAVVSASFVRWPILTVVISPDAGAQGYGLTLDAGVPGLVCPGPCTIDAQPGTPYLLSHGSPFARLFCDGGVCAGTLTSDTTVTARFGLYNRAFVSPEALPANLGGVAPYSAACRDWAADAGLPSTNWIAWMAADAGTTDPRGTATTTRGWVRVDGKPFVDQLYSPRMFYPPSIDSRGLDLTRDGGTVATAGVLTVAAGPSTTPPSGFSNCLNWTQMSGQYSQGIVSGNQWSFAAGFATNCTTPARVLCLQNDWSTQLPEPGLPSGGKLAFLAGPVTASALSTTTVCNGGPAGRTFSVLRATTSMSAFGVLGSPAAGVWYRPDGTQVATANDLALTTGVAFTAPVLQFADGGYVATDPASAFTGASAPGALGIAAETCDDWVTTMGQRARVTRLNDAASGFTAGSIGFCQTPAYYYCFER